MAAYPEQQTVLLFEDARRIVEEHAASLRSRGRELLALLDTVGRVLAEPIHADRDYPPFPRAARDGYALRASARKQSAAANCFPRARIWAMRKLG